MYVEYNFFFSKIRQNNVTVWYVPGYRLKWTQFLYILIITWIFFFIVIIFDTTDVVIFLFRLTVLGCAMLTVSSEVLPSSTSEVSGFRMMLNAYRQCSDQSEMVVCLKSRALRMLDRAIHMENIQITDGNHRTLHLK